MVHDELRRAYRTLPTDPELSADEAPVAAGDELGDLLDRLRSSDDERSCPPAP